MATWSNHRLVDSKLQVAWGPSPLVVGKRLTVEGCCGQVVRLWGPGGEAVAHRRTTASMLSSSRLGCHNTVAWHPYRTLLASGGADSTVAIWSFDLPSTTAPHGPAGNASSP